MALVDRLSKLDAPDREVDGIIAEIFGYPQEVFGDSFGTDDVDGPEMHYDAATWSGNGKSWSAPFFTASVDAAIALAERVLPGWKRSFFENFNGKWIARVCSPRRDLYSTDYLRDTELGGSPNGGIALCIAILRAKEASKL